MLISLLLTEVFVFATDEFSALPATLLDLFMLAVLGSARAALERDDEPVNVPAPAEPTAAL